MTRTFKGIRSDLCMTAKQMAEALGLNEKTYRNIENGKTVTPASVFVDMCMLGGIDLEDLAIPRRK